MKIPQHLTDAEHAEADQIAAEIRRRPGYRFARVWIERNGLATAPPTAHPTSVRHMAAMIELGTGARLEFETMVVALEDAGIALIRLHRCQDGSLDADVMVDERTVLDPLEKKQLGLRQRPWARLWSDDADGVLQ